MATSHKASLAKLEKKLNSLNGSFGGLGNGEDVQELLKIIHRPGWTTPAELLFVHGIVDSMQTHITALGTLKSALVNASKQVGVQ